MGRSSEYFAVVDGIPTRLATTREMATILGDGNTYIEALIKPPSGLGSQLARHRHLLMPGGFDMEVADSEEYRAAFSLDGGIEETTDGLSQGSAGFGLQSNNDVYDVGQYLYLNQETLLVSTDIGGGSYTIARGQLNTQDLPHRTGAIVSTRPRFLRGRRVVLYRVNRETGAAAAIRGGFIARSPKERNGIWSFSVVDLQSQLRRQLYQGWMAEKAVAARSVDGDTFVFTVADARRYDLTADGFLQVRWPGGFEVFRLDSTDIDTSANTLTIQGHERLETLTSGVQSESPGGESRWARYIGDTPDSELDLELRIVQFDAGDPATIALRLLQSNLGNGSNGSYDAYPGLNPVPVGGTTDLVPARIGAGYPSAWIDTASWQAARGVARPIHLFIDGPTDVLALLTQEIAPLLGGWVTATADGKIGFKRYLPAVPTADVVTIGPDQIAEDASTFQHDESQALSYAILESNYRPERRTFERITEVSFPDVVERFGTNAPSYKWQSKLLWIGSEREGSQLNSPAISPLDVVAIFDRLHARTRNGVKRRSYVLDAEQIPALEPGDVADLTDPDTPDGAGGRGVTSKRVEITSTNLTEEMGKVAIETEEMQEGYLIAPAATVDFWVGGSLDVYLVGSDALHDGSPSQDFAEDWYVDLLDASASPPFSTASRHRIAAVGASYLRLDGSPSFTPANGDKVRLAETADDATNSLGAIVADHGFGVDSNGQIDAVRDGTVWG